MWRISNNRNNKIDMNSINDMASSTGETKEDENPEENLLIEIKTWSKIKDGLDNADADAEEIAARRATEYIDDEMTWKPQVVISFLNYLHNHKSYLAPMQSKSLPELKKILEPL
ncbi:unnamed protein product [Rhizophagus irregularis]|nr:unnamed protein product [Rhizophagus irregularis]